LQYETKWCHIASVSGGKIEKGTEMPAAIASGSTPHGFNRRQLIVAGALAIAASSARATPPAAEANTGISRTEEAIHQERLFAAKRKRVYAALTVEKQFDRIVQLSGVMKSEAMARMQTPTRLSAHEGGTFALFGGYIVGRQLQLVADELIVQAWRELSWPRGVYSMTRFELSDQGESTRLVFDHTAFPRGEAEHLASGWQEHYWDPLSTLLAQD
jgi:activator of HSP90 ATPase